MTFEVRFQPAARVDIVRLHDFHLARASTIEDLDLAERAVDEIELACAAQLARTPHIFRRAGGRPTRRELVIPFGGTGYVALYEIASPDLVVVLARRYRASARETQKVNLAAAAKKFSRKRP